MLVEVVTGSVQIIIVKYSCCIKYADEKNDLQVLMPASRETLELMYGDPHHSSLGEKQTNLYIRGCFPDLTSSFSKPFETLECLFKVACSVFKEFYHC